jgi:hypothetical protein
MANTTIAAVSKRELFVAAEGPPGIIDSISSMIMMMVMVMMMSMIMPMMSDMGD